MFAKIFGCFAVSTAHIFMWLHPVAYGQEQSITIESPLAKPVPAVPPSIPRHVDPGAARHEEFRANELKKERSKDDAVLHAAEIERQNDLQNDLDKSKPMHGQIEIALIVPRIQTSGQRKRYKGDITISTSYMQRFRLDAPSESLQPWWGFRIAPFTGYGTQNGLTDRFAWTFFGPGVGFGRIDSQPQLQGAQQTTSQTSPSRTGWLVMTGVSMVSKQKPPGGETSGSDFESKPVGFESPGVWLEGRWSRVFHGALSANAMAGAQLADHKNIFYCGVGLGAWL